MSFHMKPVYPALLAWIALASPAWAADATLEGYGGDGAVLVGLDSEDSPFGAARPGGRPGGDGNLVAETGPAPAAAPQTAVPPVPPSPRPPAGEEAARDPGGGRDRQGGPPADPRGARPASPDPLQRQVASATLVEEESVSPSSGGGGLPFTSLELAFLLGGTAGIAAMALGMRRLVAAQPRF